MMTAEYVKPKFRLGLLLDSPLASKYVIEFIKRSQSHDKMEIAHLLFHPSEPIEGTARLHPLLPSTDRRARSPISDLFFRLIIGIERLFLLKNHRHYDHLQQFDLLALLPNTIAHQLREDDDVRSIETLDLDLLITFSTRPPLKRMGNIAQLGVIAVSHSDDYIYQDGPAGFWEVYFRRDVTGFTIERLKDTSDAREVLLRGRVGTQFYYLLNQASLFEKSSYYLFKLVERIVTTGSCPKSEPNWPTCHIPRGIPSAHQTIFYLTGLIRLATRKLFEKLWGYKFQWNVAFVRSDWRNAALWRASIIENPPQHYLADPFLISRKGNDFCYVEDYDNLTKRGKITAYALGPPSVTCLGVALEESFHLSYPYLFEYDGELYMCPETSENRDIRIYKCLDFPLGWKLEKIIMKNVLAADTILVEKDGKWWMLTNIDPAEWGDFSLELCLFSAKSPLDEEWIPHPGNPFHIDASRTRNGGIIREGERLFRVAQAQGFDMYGRRSSVNEIIELNDQSYVENCVCVISPTFKGGIVGTHHLHSNGNMTIVDFAHDGRAQ
jgi:hypothetical protein